MADFSEIRIDGYQRINSETDTNKGKEVKETEQTDGESIFAQETKPEVSPNGMIYVTSSDSTRDGVISFTKQGGVGDCGALSAITALSYTTKGAEILKGLFDYTYNYTTVHLATGDYKADDSKMAKYARQHRTASKDDDMAILEIALEKAVDDIVRGKKFVSAEAPWEIQMLLQQSVSTNRTSSIEGIYPNAVFYLLTGKTGEYFDDKELMNKKLNEFQKNGHKSLAMTAVSNFYDGYTGILERTGTEEQMKDMTDINTGKKITITDAHAFTVKDVSKDGVTLVNPWDTSKSITISRSDFLDNYYIMCCDLSDKNVIGGFITDI